MPRRSTETSASREHGAHYTPHEVSEQLVRDALEIALPPMWDHRDILAMRVVDPACGDGELLVQAALYLAEHLASTPKHRALQIDTRTGLERLLTAGCIVGNELRADAAEAARAHLSPARIDIGDGLQWAYPSEGPLHVIMNPPFLGGTKISGQLGADVHARTRALTGSGRTDLAVAFLRSAAAAVEAAPRGGTLSAILPSALTEGDNRVHGLAALLARGWQIVRAQTKRKWPGDAKVMYVMVHMVAPLKK